MKKILITGGPVHGKLDDVKIISNRFKGGLIAKLADQLSERTEVIYLTSRGSKVPKNEDIKVIYHDGLFDYQDIVLKMAPDMDAVILGGAVANLVPQTPIEGKFPSHNYNVGDVVNIPFVIAPRIIDKVKEVAPKVHLFGFKLLSNVPHEELINAAYGIVLDSKATCVFANDTNDLTIKYAVTKERSVIKLTTDNYAEFILKAIEDKYFSTIVENEHLDIDENSLKLFKSLKDSYADKFDKLYGGKYRFGTIAVKMPDGRILTTGRGKKELSEMSIINRVDFEKRIVYSSGKKATLNAPLLANIFANNDISAVVHYHELTKGLKVEPYAFPGTERDSLRNVDDSFVIEPHGTFILIK